MTLAELLLAGVAVYLLYRVLRPLQQKLEKKMLSSLQKRHRHQRSGEVIDISHYKSESKEKDQST